MNRFIEGGVSSENVNSRSVPAITQQEVKVLQFGFGLPPSDAITQTEKGSVQAGSGAIVAIDLPLSDDDTRHFGEPHRIRMQGGQGGAEDEPSAPGDQTMQLRPVTGRTADGRLVSGFGFVAPEDPEVPHRSNQPSLDTVIASAESFLQEESTGTVLEQLAVARAMHALEAVRSLREGSEAAVEHVFGDEVPDPIKKCVERAYLHLSKLEDGEPIDVVGIAHTLDVSPSQARHALDLLHIRFGVLRPDDDTWEGYTVRKILLPAVQHRTTVEDHTEAPTTDTAVEVASDEGEITTDGIVKRVFARLGSNSTYSDWRAAMHVKMSLGSVRHTGIISDQDIPDGIQRDKDFGHLERGGLYAEDFFKAWQENKIYPGEELTPTLLESFYNCHYYIGTEVGGGVSLLWKLGVLMPGANVYGYRYSESDNTCFKVNDTWLPWQDRTREVDAERQTAEDREVQIILREAANKQGCAAVEDLTSEQRLAALNEAWRSFGKQICKLKDAFRMDRTPRDDQRLANRYSIQNEIRKIQSSPAYTGVQYARIETAYQLAAQAQDA